MRSNFIVDKDAKQLYGVKDAKQLYRVKDAKQLLELEQSSFLFSNGLHLFENKKCKNYVLAEFRKESLRN
jgi:sugar lactone lactonase YvrE